MRKHHKRWVALIGAAAIASSGLVGIPAVAEEKDEKDAGTVMWPEVNRDFSPYVLDGYEIGYLPAGLEKYGVSTSSVTDRLGNRQTRMSWRRGPDQLLGRISILRSDRFQSLEDLREHRYSHLPERTLERLASGEALRNEAYLSPETGDLFWMEEAGVAVAMYLQPDRWGSGELVRMAESLTKMEEEPPEESSEESGDPAAEEPTVEEPSQEGGESGAAEESGQGKPAEESGGTEEPSQGEAQVDSDQAEGARVQQAKECVIHRFVNFETGETSLAGAEMTPSSREFVERALALEELSDEELNRLLATVWYYGDENAKTSAVDDCARNLDMTSAEVETIIYGLASVIAELVEAAEQHETTHEETVARTLDVVEDTLPVEPIGAAEWEEMVTSLPWSLPTRTS